MDEFNVVQADAVVTGRRAARCTSTLDIVVSSSSSYAPIQFMPTTMAEPPYRTDILEERSPVVSVTGIKARWTQRLFL